MNSSSHQIVSDVQEGIISNWSYIDLGTPNQSTAFSHRDSTQYNNIHLENFEKVIRWMNIYFLPTLILVGVVGNSLSVCVFILSHLRRLSSSVYLAALAVADAGFLFCALAEWCHYIGFQFSHKNGKFYFKIFSLK